MKNDFKNYAVSRDSHAVDAFIITVGDQLVSVTRGLWIGKGGNLVATMEKGGDPITFKNIPSGCMLPFAVQAVEAGTTCSDIVGLV